MNGRIVFSVFLTLVLIAGAIGLGVYAYNLGVAQGMATSGKLDVPPATGVAPYPYFYGPFFYRPFGFGWGLVSCLIPLFFIFVFFGVMRMVFWRARWGGMHRRWEGGVPPMAEEWHRKMHESQATDKKSNA